MDRSPELGPCLVGREEQQQLQRLLQVHDSVFASEQRPLGKARVTPMRIPTGNASPVRQKLRAVAHDNEIWLREEVEQGLKLGIIRPSNSEWAANPVFVPKPGQQKPRVAQDYRSLNAVTAAAPFPMPTLQSAVDKMAGSTVFSTMDLKSAYLQCPLASADAAKTAFYGHDGLYEYKVVSFGLKGAPAYFQRMINSVLRGIPGVLAYIDDLIVFSKTVEEHLRTLEAVFKRLQEVDLLLSKTKCHFMVSSVKYLGVTLDASGRRPTSEKVDAFRQLQVPQDVKALRSLLGAFSFYREFIPGFAAMAAPLTALTRRAVAWNWSAECGTALNQLKEALATCTTLMFPDWDKAFEVATDASGVAIGAALMQRDDLGRLQPVAFVSRALTTAEKNYSVTRQECLAVVWSLGKFAPYVQHRRFTLVTDHAALQWLATKPDLNGQLMRWALQLQTFDMVIVHRPGSTNVVADCLSRMVRSDDDGVVAAVPSSIHREDIVAAQAADEFCQNTIQRLHDDSSKGRKDLDLFTLDEEGALVRVAARPGAPARLVVPKACVPRVLELLHNDPVAGHQGVSRAHQSALLRFFWSGMWMDIRRHVMDCHDCAERKSPRPGPQPMGFIDSSGPMEVVAMDVMGPLPESADGHRFVLVVADVFTKFVAAMPLLDQTAASVCAAFLSGWVGVHGPPRQLLTDRGTHFSATEASQLFEALQVKKIWTAAYHPQTDGQVERFNRFLADALSTCAREHQDWHQHLPLVVHAYNAAPHATTGASPFLMLYGREALRPADAINEAADTSVWLARARAARQLVWGAADRRLQELRAPRALPAPPPAFAEGELVLVFDPTNTPGQPEKLKRRWSRRARIIKVISSKAYRVRILRTGNESTVNAERLKKAPASLPEAEETDSDSEASAGEEEGDSSEPGDVVPRRPGSTPGQRVRAGI